MKRNQLNIYFAFVLLVVVATIFWLSHHSGKKSDMDKDIGLTARSSDTSSSTVRTNLDELTKLSGQNQLLQDTPQTKVESINNAMAVWSQKIHRPIEFYGKVIDENNQPIVGADVEMVWTQFSPLPEGSFKTNVISDQNGSFSVGGVVGASLGVYVNKVGYYVVNSTNKSNFIYSALPGFQPFQPDPNNPVLFYLRKKGIGATLITSQNGIKKYLGVSMPLDGSPVRVNLLTRSVGQDGQLIVSQVKPTNENWKQATSWSFKIEIPDGGFIEESDEFPFEAPSSGYQPEIEFDFQQGQTNWTTDIQKDFYIKLGSPTQYGRLHVDTSIDMSGVRLTYAINPDGTQNLEPK